MKSFESHIQDSKPAVVDFSATWCQPCRLMEPVLHELKEKVGDRATILKVDIDKTPYFTELYNIRSVPTILIFKEGNILWRKSGLTSAQEIMQQLSTHFS